MKKIKRKPIVLYHFCAAHMLKGIMEEGLTLGTFPLLEDERYRLIPNIQWLTAEPNAKKQSWATNSLVTYSRTAYRLTIQIPGSYHKKVIKASDYVKSMPPEARLLVEAWNGSDQWFVFTGRIPPEWIVGCRSITEK